MKANSYAIVTPSFRLDYDRCALLCESVQRYVQTPVHHYLVIDRRDVPMFKPLTGPRTEILIVEDVIPGWIMRIPKVRKFWLSLRSMPIRNWILQQIVKLSVPIHVDQDALLYTDSDTFFVRPFDPLAFERDGRVPLSVEYGQRGKISFNDRWHGVAAKLIGLPVETGYDTNYVGNVIPWRRANVLKLHAHIESITGKPWQLALASQLVFSEYILYGLFCERVLGFEAAGHWPDSAAHTHTYWHTSPMDTSQLEDFKQALNPQQHAVMISAKSHTPAKLIREVFFG